MNHIARYKIINRCSKINNNDNNVSNNNKRRRKRRNNRFRRAIHSKASKTAAALQKYYYLVVLLSFSVIIMVSLLFVGLDQIYQQHIDSHHMEILDQSTSDQSGNHLMYSQTKPAVSEQTSIPLMFRNLIVSAEHVSKNPNGDLTTSINLDPVTHQSRHHKNKDNSAYFHSTTSPSMTNHAVTKSLSIPSVSKNQDYLHNEDYHQNKHRSQINVKNDLSKNIKVVPNKDDFLRKYCHNCRYLICNDECSLNQQSDCYDIWCDQCTLTMVKQCLNSISSKISSTREVITNTKNLIRETTKSEMSKAIKRAVNPVLNRAPASGSFLHPHARMHSRFNPTKSPESTKTETESKRNALRVDSVNGGFAQAFRHINIAYRPFNIGNRPIVMQNEDGLHSKSNMLSPLKTNEKLIHHISIGTMLALLICICIMLAVILIIIFKRIRKILIQHLNNSNNNNHCATLNENVIKSASNTTKSSSSSSIVSPTLSFNF